jgi:hypothetical protein
MDELRLHRLLSCTAPLLGIIEKRTTSGTELHIVYHDQREYIRLSRIIETTGGLMKIPSLVISGSLVHILNLWVSQILQI